MSAGPALLDRPVEPERPPVPPADGPGPTRTRELAIGVAVVAAIATILTTTALSKVFDGFRWWFLPGAGAVLTAFACGLLGRWARLPLLLSPFVYGLGLVLYLPAVSAPETMRGPFPTVASWSAVRELVGVGTEDVRRLAIPVPPRAGLVLLVVLGTYAVACAVDVICTRLRSPATAGLPLLALLAVPAAIVPGDVGLVPFALGAVGYLLLLGADGRSRRPERTSGPAGASGGHAPGTLRIGLIGLAAAVLLPTLLPGPGRGLITPPSNDSTNLGSDGNGRARVVQPFVTLDQQLRSTETIPLLQVKTDTPEYLRLTALEVFDGARFSLGRLQADPDARVRNGLPPPTLVRSSPARGQVRVRDVYRQRYLPVPYTPTAISVDGDWRLQPQTSTVFSGRTDTGGTHYSYVSQVPTPTAADLRAEPAPASLPADVGIDLRLPGVDPDVLALADQLTAKAATTYDKVAAIQAYLRSPLFTYDLNGAPRDGRRALHTFLLDSHRGYCEQFASAMAVLVRAIKVPARVAIGFTPGSRDASGDWVITNRDAHAWPEVWFPTAGWVRFEPTPRDDSTEVTPDYSVPPPPGSTADDSSTSGAGERDAGPKRGTTSATAPSQPLSTLPGPGAASTASSSHSWTWPVAGLAVVLGAALLTLPALARLHRRRRRLRAADGVAAWAEVSDTAADLGYGVLPTESPRAAGRRWAELVAGADDDGTGAEGGAGIALIALAQQAERARFARLPKAAGVGGGSARSPFRTSAPAGSTTGRSSDPGGAARRAVVALERVSSRRARLRAWLLPRSLGVAAARWWEDQRDRVASALRPNLRRGGRRGGRASL